MPRHVHREGNTERTPGTRAELFDAAVVGRSWWGSSSLFFERENEAKRVENESVSGFFYLVPLAGVGSGQQRLHGVCAKSKSSTK